VILKWITKIKISKLLNYLITQLPITALITFLFVNFLSFLFAQYPSRSLEVFLYTAFVAVFAFCTSRFFKTLEPQKKEKIIWALIISSFIVCLFGLFQFVGDFLNLPSSLTLLSLNYQKEILGFPRIQSTFIEPLYFANFLLIPLSLIIPLFFAKRIMIRFADKKSLSQAREGGEAAERAGVEPGETSEAEIGAAAASLGQTTASFFTANRSLFFLLLLFTFNLFLTVSRGAWLGFLASLGVIIWFPARNASRSEAGGYRKAIFQNKKVILAGAGALLVAAAAIALFPPLRAHLITAHGSAFSERNETFQLAIQAFKEHPLLGLGPGGFGPYAAGRLYWSPNEGWKIVNNLYLELLAETGIIGLIAFLAFIASLLYSALKAIMKEKEPFSRAIRIGFLATFIGMLVQYNTFSILYLMPFWFVIGSLMGVTLIYTDKAD
jgi:O-antigen ligase